MKTIYKNGAVYTGKLPLVEAFAVEDGKFVFAGSSAEADALAAAGDKVVDLGGKFVCSGFNDSHMHLLNYGSSLLKAQLAAHTESLEDMLACLDTFQKEHPRKDGAWLMGRGWNQDYFTDVDRMPNRYDLDRVSTEVPICATRACGHCLVVNSKALELLGVTADTPQPEGGEIGMENGEPDGSQALEAGKHVYTEKTMTLAPETAAKLIELAEEKHLYLGSAPDTFLGSALQTARKAIDDGLIGEVTSFEACANRDLDLLASIFRFLRMPGGGICYDFGVYYLTAIVSLFGPVDRVVSSVRNLAPKRVNVVPDSPEYGQEFDYSNESQAFTILEMKNGVTGTFCVNGDSTINDQAVFTIYGKKGILKLVDPNNFGGDIVYIPGVKDWTQQAVPEVLDYGFAYSENSRGLGPSEMAEAIAEGRLNRANAKMAYHVLDVIDQIMKSAKSGAFEKVPSTCERPAALPVPEKEQ